MVLCKIQFKHPNGNKFVKTTQANWILPPTRNYKLKSQGQMGFSVSDIKFSWTLQWLQNVRSNGKCKDDYRKLNHRRTTKFWHHKAVYMKL